MPVNRSCAIPSCEVTTLKMMCRKHSALLPAELERKVSRSYDALMTAVTIRDYPLFPFRQRYCHARMQAIRHVVQRLREKKRQSSSV